MALIIANGVLTNYIPEAGETEVVIPQGVIRIGSRAFYDCGDLESIVVPKSVTVIGKEAFCYCNGLTSIVIPDSVTSIGDRAFYWCIALGRCGIMEYYASLDLPPELIREPPYVIISPNIPITSHKLKTPAGYGFLMRPDLFTGDIRKGYLDYVLRQTSKLLPFVFERDLVSALEIFADSGKITVKNYEESFLKPAQEAKALNCTAFIMDWVGRHFTAEQKDKEFERQLNKDVYNAADMKKLWKYEKTEQGVRILGYKGKKTDVTVPPRIGKDTVTGIGEKAFGYSSLTSVTIPDSVTSIEHGAFSGCNSLTDFTVDEKNPVYHSAGNCIIETATGTLVCGCNVSVIPADGSVTGIGEYAFDGCRGLTKIVIPDGVTSIGGYAFAYCKGLTTIIIPDGVTCIGEYAFNWCNGLISIVIPDSVTEIGSNAFEDCEKLTSIAIRGDGSVKSIGDSAFSRCKSLTSITIPDSVTSIGDGAFNGCSNLKGETWGDGLYLGSEKRPYRVLLEMSGWTITSCEIHPDTEIICSSAFFGCGSLTSVTIHDGVKSIGVGALSGCRGLNELTVADGNSVYHSAGNCIIETATGTLVCGCKTSVIPADGSVTVIGNEAFRSCSDLRSITIPDNVTSIGDGAFSNCESLTSITIPDSVTSIGKWAFSGCESLTSISIPVGVTDIKRESFHGCRSLKHITIPESVTVIGSTAFYGCSSLTSVTIPGSVAEIGGLAFDNCKCLTSVVISDGVTSIEGYAFSNCISLITVTIPSSVKKIEDCVFRGCHDLTVHTPAGSAADIYCRKNKIEVENDI